MDSRKHNMLNKQLKPTKSAQERPRAHKTAQGRPRAPKSAHEHPRAPKFETFHLCFPRPLCARATAGVMSGVKRKGGDSAPPDVVARA